MDSPEIVITSLVVMFLLAAGVWAVTAGREIKYPAGTRRDVRGPGDTRVVVISDLDVSPALANACASAVLATARAADLGGKHLSHFVVWFREDSNYENKVLNYREFVRSTNAYLAQVPRAIGSGPPMAVIRASLRNHVMRTGQPVIHECLHHVIRHTRDSYADPHHKIKEVWGHGGLEAVAQRTFTDLNKIYVV